MTALCVTFISKQQRQQQQRQRQQQQRQQQHLRQRKNYKFNQVA